MPTAVGIPGNAIASIERLSTLPMRTITSTSGLLVVVPTGTLVAVGGFWYKGDLATALFVIQSGAGTTQWVVELDAAGEIAMEFDHPLILDGLIGGLASGAARRWSLSYHILGGGPV